MATTLIKPAFLATPYTPTSTRQTTTLTQMLDLYISHYIV